MSTIVFIATKESNLIQLKCKKLVPYDVKLDCKTNTCKVMKHIFAPEHKQL